MDTPPNANRERPITPDHPKLCSTNIEELILKMKNKDLPYKLCGLCKPNVKEVKVVDDKKLKVREWYLSNVKPSEIDNKIQAKLNYFGRFMEPENNRLRGSFRVGHNEADGSLGVFYREDI